MKLIKFHFLFFIIFFASILLSCADNPNSIKVTNWQILCRQDASLELVSSSKEWQPVKIPGIFYLPYPREDGFQYVWLKGEFNVSGDPDTLYGLSTGRMRLADEIYINGRLTGSRSPARVNWDPVPRNYPIQRGLLKKGINSVYVRLGVYSSDYAGISGDVLIQKEDEFKSAEFINNLIYLLLPFGIVFLFSTMIAVFIISYLIDKKEKLHLHGALVMLIINIYVLISLPFYRFVDFGLFYGIKSSIVFLVSIFMILILQAIIRISLPAFNRIVVPLLLLFAINITVFCEIGYVPSVIKSLKYIYFITLIPVFSIMLYRFVSINRSGIKKTEPFAKRLVIMILVLFVGIMALETFFPGEANQYSGLFSILFPPLFIISWAVLVPKQIMKRRLEMELLYDKLKTYEGRVKEVSITESSEEKLKRVTAFIDDNYTSDISREGLAAAVDMNPGYMGGLFKTYTGKTINEYINSLRVEEAKRQLDAGGSKIIDIAFSVGFENSVTFNRVFKKITGQTPSEYREKKQDVNNQS